MSQIYLLANEVSILHKLVNYFQNILPVNEWADVQVVLPTARLGQVLLAKLSEQRTAFVAPRILTWTKFCQELLQEFSPQMIPISAPGIEALVGKILEHGSFSQILPGHEHELIHLLQSAFSHGWTIGELVNRLREGVFADIYLSDKVQLHLLQRIKEMESVWLALSKALADSNLCISREAQACLAKDITDSEISTWLLSKSKKFIIAGLTTLNNVERSLLKKFLYHKKVELWLQEPPQLNNYENPMAEVLSDFSEVKQDFSTSSPIDSYPLSIPNKQFVVDCVDQLEETSVAFALLRHYELLGIPLPQLALIIPNENHYRDIVVALSKEYPGQINQSMAFLAEHSLLGNLLTKLAKVVLNPDDPTSITSFFADKIWHTFLDSSAVQNLGNVFDDILDEYLRKGLLTDFWSMIEKIINPANSIYFSLPFIPMLNEFYLLQKQYKKLPFSQWTRILQKTFSMIMETKNAAFSEEFFQKEQQAFQSMESIFSEMAILSAFWPELSMQSFFMILSKYLANAKIHQHGYAFCGLQILSLEEARHIPFAVACVLGANEGLIPGSIPPDSLIDEHQKKLSGLKGWAYLEAVEETSFVLLTHNCKQLFYFSPKSQLGIPTGRSRFVEYALAKAQASLITALQLKEQLDSPKKQDDSLGKNSHEDKIISLSSASEPIPKKNQQILPSANFYSPELKPLFNQASPSALEKLIKCPLAFVVHQLKIQDYQLPRPWDPRIIGNWLHRVLEIFTKEAANNNFIDLTDPQHQKTVLNRIMALTTDLTPSGYHDNWLFSQLRYIGWPGFLSLYHLLTNMPTTTRTLESHQAELNFDDARVAKGNDIELNMSFRGIIDAIDTFSDMVLISDYKFKNIPFPADIAKGIIPQLLIYHFAYQYQLSSSKPVVCAYFSIEKGTWQLGFCHESLFETSRHLWQMGPKVKHQNFDLNLISGRLLALLDWRLHENKGEPDLTPDTSRCEYCSFAYACPKNEPRHKAALAHGKRLHSFLSTQGSSKEIQES